MPLKQPGIVAEPREELHGLPKIVADLSATHSTAMASQFAPPWCLKVFAEQSRQGVDPNKEMCYNNGCSR